MKTVLALEAPELPTPHQVSVRKLHDAEHAQIMLISLKPGETLKRHITPVDVVFYALEGQGVVEIGEERQSVAAHTLVESPAGIPHRLSNESAGLFRCLVIKTPRPNEAAKLL